METKKAVKKTSSFTQVAMSEANNNRKMFDKNLSQHLKYMKVEGLEDTELMLSTVNSSLNVEEIKPTELLPYLKLVDKNGVKRELFSYYEVLRAVKKLAVQN